ncbi:SCP2 sterol-binding domain-containing protein [Candidatus Comchoanobacter bicostacola]|uniref:SCP2 sterol-binding domain-containing protein n=1 Tax=Candidatus Comchoanobacter bicostacola TaxID=2919598 RepID=A0ABY5DJB2_9GAMM|nr:SCP2 sterol-binding domain-containing protein [Candidatus Comchoanobacter bicostacola]UTC24633.1 SCP2 sterol-binding domain-containing protein [Candidatus Comchoanobacter bicostacola]
MNTVELLKRLPLDQIGARVLIQLEDKAILIDEKGSVHEGENDNPVVTLRLSESDLQGALTGDESVVSLFVTGRIAVEGDMDIALKLKNIMG